MKKRARFGDLNSLASSAYAGTATFGKDYAIIIGSLQILLGIIILCVGIYLIRRKPLYSVPIKFTVLTNGGPKTTTTNTVVNGVDTPQITTTYNLVGTAPGCKGNVILNNYTENAAIGSVISAYMKPDCIDNIASQSSDSTTVIGWIVLGVGILLILWNIFRIFFVKKYKGVAALQGVAGGKNILSHLFR